MIDFKDNFEAWAERCVLIRDKVSGRDIPLRLNDGQKKVVETLERQRRDSRPLRAIVLKARQWGCSTVIMAYMAWIQIVHCRNWHSVILAHVKDSAANIRGMYSKIIDNYPEEFTDEPLRFKPFERSINSREIVGRGCRVIIGSCENQDALRGNDIAMVHMSEVAYWRLSDNHDPADLVRSVISSVPMVPLSMIVMESTANGVGSFFHREWLRAEAGKSDKEPIFVAWHDISYNRLAVDDSERLLAELSPYEKSVMEMYRLDLEQIAWYHAKNIELGDERKMMSEFPSSPAEAFAASGEGVFPAEKVEILRRGCREPSLRGEFYGVDLRGPDALTAVRWHADPDGLTKVWEMPRRGLHYVVAVDVGGRSKKSDWSVIAVMTHDIRPRVVAQWRGHIDHDLLAWKAAATAKAYNSAILVIESNTLETSAANGEPLVLLDELGCCYPRLYWRKADDGLGMGRRIGFHTNVRTKAAIIAGLVADVRDGSYAERDNDACDELLTYEQLPNGSYRARKGCHDDILMTRAIGLHVIAHENPWPVSSPDAADMW